MNEINFKPEVGRLDTVVESMLLKLLSVSHTHCMLMPCCALYEAEELKECFSYMMLAVSLMCLDSVTTTNFTTLFRSYPIFC